jgi:NAD(P)-dependent dehydrogenase (short-subunit alcohol dehydrogenase family)
LLLSPPTCRDLERLRAVVSGKTILVTGASFGIGEATTLLLAKAGAHVLLVARSADKLHQLAASIAQQGGQATAYPADLYKVAEVPALMERIQTAHPRIDIVISNAGKSIRRRITESFGRDDLERSVALNFLSPAAMLMSLLPRMIAQGGGQIVNVSSVSARQPGAPRWGTYQSSKAGFDAWLRSVANELRPQGIYASSVYLPLVRTRMIAPTPFYQRLPALSPQEAALVIAYAIVRRPERVAPWWLWWSELITLLVPTPIHRLLTYLDQRLPD